MGVVHERSSRCFVGEVGVSRSPAVFSRANLLFRDDLCQSEGNWAFCRFPGNEEIFAARVGFLRGSFDFSDFGGQPVEAYAQLHVELMTREGAVLWLPYGKYRAHQIIPLHDELDVRMGVPGGELFTLRGWPRSEWRFQSDDGTVGVRLEFDMHAVGLLPDCVLPHNVFAMWEGVGRVAGHVWLGSRKFPVNGTVFWDHPRVLVTRNAVARRSWYLYTPLVFPDGDAVITYYAEDEKGCRIDGYCFGVYYTSSGETRFMPEMELVGLTFDADDLPATWRLRGAGEGLELEAEVAVRPTTILKSWGSPRAPQVRRDFVYIPLVTDAQCRMNPGKETALETSASGLSEYWRLPEPGVKTTLLESTACLRPVLRRNPSNEM